MRENPCSAFSCFILKLIFMFVAGSFKYLQYGWDFILWVWDYSLETATEYLAPDVANKMGTNAWGNLVGQKQNLEKHK